MVFSRTESFYTYIKQQVLICFMLDIKKATEWSRIIACIITLSRVKCYKMLPSFVTLERELHKRADHFCDA